MKKIFKSLIFLLFIVIVHLSSNPVFAQNQTVEFDINRNEVKKSDDGYFYYEIEGWWEPSSKGSYYLILDYNNTKVDLCKFEVKDISQNNLKYPRCNGMTSGHVVTSENSYKIYFSNSSKGNSISSCYSNGENYFKLSDVPEYTHTNEYDVLDNWVIRLKKDNNGKYYYDINADVIDGKQGFVRINLSRVDGNGENMFLNSAFNLSEAKFSVSTKDLAPSIYSGEYKIDIYEENKPGNPIQTYNIGEAVPNPVNGGNPSGNGNNNGGSTTNTGGGTNSGDGLVSTTCGYDNGPMCDFSDIMSLINRIINFIFVLVLPIAAIIFAYAGYLYIVSAGDPQKRTAAKNAMTKLVIGVVIIMIAWILVKTILVALGVKSGFSFLNMRN